MNRSENKLPYEAPKIFRVVLNHDQAILAGCTTATTSNSGSTGTSCRSTCRRSSTSSQDSAQNS